MSVRNRPHRHSIWLRTLPR